VKRLALFTVFVILLCSPKTFAEKHLIANDGKYLGCVDCNQYDARSIHNQYGKYGSQYSSDSINNQYGTYGNPYSIKKITIYEMPLGFGQ
jgi:hypothetical protein